MFSTCKRSLVDKTKLSPHALKGLMDLQANHGMLRTAYKFDNIRTTTRVQCLFSQTNSTERTTLKAHLKTQRNDRYKHLTKQSVMEVRIPRLFCFCARAQNALCVEVFVP